jgi:hypothetical protein
MVIGILDPGDFVGLVDFLELDLSFPRLRGLCASSGFESCVIGDRRVCLEIDEVEIYVCKVDNRLIPLSPRPKRLGSPDGGHFRPRFWAALAPRPIGSRSGRP